MKKTIFCLFAVVAIAISSCSKDSGNLTEGTPYFEMSSSQLFLEQEVSFTNNSENASVYRWNFGDGNKSQEKNPTHRYSAPGEYIVSLQVGPSTVLEKKLTVHDGDRAVYVVNDLEADLDITLFDRISTNQIGTKRYTLGAIKGGAQSDTLYVKDDALGIAGFKDEVTPFLILDPIVFDLEKGIVNKLEINEETNVIYGIGLPQ